MLETLGWIALGATLMPAYRAATARSEATRAALLTVLAMAAALATLASVDETAWIALAQEDATVEWATVLAFGLAALGFVRTLRKERGALHATATLLLAAFCVVVAGEEISWGQRLLGFKPPDVFLERNFQQELNLHNVLMDERGLGFAIESRHLVIAIALGYGLVGPWIVSRPRFAALAPLAPPLALAPIFVAVVAAQLAYAVELTGEGAELVLGLGFLAAALLACERSRRRTVAWLVGCLVGGWLVSIGVSRIVFGSDHDGARVAAAELDVLAREVVAGATPKLARKNIHKRVFTSVVDGYLRLERPRTDRHGYYLDPWNNPYWIAFDRRSRRGFVYSFGPNRRRDLSTRDLARAPGDDVVVSFSIPVH